MEKNSTTFEFYFGQKRVGGSVARTHWPASVGNERHTDISIELVASPVKAEDQRAVVVPRGEGVVERVVRYGRRLLWELGVEIVPGILIRFFDLDLGGSPFALRRGR